MAPVTRRRFLSGLAATGAAIGASVGSAVPRNASARPLDEVMERGRLRVAVYRDFRPFSFQRDGTLVGIDVDLARAIA